MRHVVGVCGLCGDPLIPQRLVDPARTNDIWSVKGGLESKTEQVGIGRSVTGLYNEVKIPKGMLMAV